MTQPLLGPVSWERMIRAVKKVRERLLRATAALEQANITYAVVGGNAVAAWVSRVDEAAVRNAQDVDILLRREDLDRAKVAMAAAGFIYRHVKNIDMFLDGPDAKAHDAVHIIFENQRVRWSRSGMSAAAAAKEIPAVELRGSVLESSDK